MDGGEIGTKVKDVGTDSNKNNIHIKREKIKIYPTLYINFKSCLTC
jgi:hypothetical protein